MDAGIALHLAGVGAAPSLTRHKPPSLQLLLQSPRTLSGTQSLSADLDLVDIQPHVYSQEGVTACTFPRVIVNENTACVTRDERRTKGSNPKAKGLARDSVWRGLRSSLQESGKRKASSVLEISI